MFILQIINMKFVHVLMKGSDLVKYKPNSTHSQLTKNSRPVQIVPVSIFMLYHNVNTCAVIKLYFQQELLLNKIVYTQVSQILPLFILTGYSIEDSRIGFNVTSYPPARNAPGFIECVTKSLDDMYEVLEGRNPRKPQ